jgi:hypothetical protein
MDEVSPLLKIVSDGGGAFGLSDALYVRWWKSLPPDDRDTFANLGGDDLLGRFVCAYDFLSSVESENAQTLVNAFAIATGLRPENYETKERASRAWEHPAVRELLERLAAREFFRAERRVLRATSALVEETLEKARDAEYSTARKEAIAAAISFLNYGNEQRKANRDSRLSKENEQLKNALAETKKALTTHGELTAITREDAERYLRALRSTLGKDTILELIEGDAS